MKLIPFHLRTKLLEAKSLQWLEKAATAGGVSLYLGENQPQLVLLVAKLQQRDVSHRATALWLAAAFKRA